MKKELKETAKRYASKLFIDIKKEPLFGMELVEYIRASIMHDTSKSYHTDEFLLLCEDYVVEKYEKYFIRCPRCKKYVHKDYTSKVKKSEYRICNCCKKEINIQ